MQNYRCINGPLRGKTLEIPAGDYTIPLPDGGEVCVVIVRLGRRIRRGGGDWFIEISCPHCSEIHNHGWSKSDGQDVLSHRIAHCTLLRGRSYYLKLPASNNAEQDAPEPSTESLGVT